MMLSSRVPTERRLVQAGAQFGILTGTAAENPIA
jgi:hypothetical protein